MLFAGSVTLVNLPLEGTVLVVRALVLLERLLAVEELVAALVGTRKKHDSTPALAQQIS